MTIGQAAKVAGVAATTLRYYEREALLSPTVRNGTGYRLYDARAVERLQFIRSAQAAGFTLDDIRALLALEADNPKSCQAEVQSLIKRRLAEVDRKLKELEGVRGALGRALNRCRRSGGQCAVLKELSHPNSKRRR